MQHLRGRIAKSDVRTYVRTLQAYASSTVSRHFGAETKIAGTLKVVGQPCILHENARPGSEEWVSLMWLTADDKSQ